MNDSLEDRILDVVYAIEEATKRGREKRVRRAVIRRMKDIIREEIKHQIELENINNEIED